MKIKLALTVFFLSLFSFLLAAQIHAISVSAEQTNPITSGVVGYFRMNEASWSGTIKDVLDSSGLNNSGKAIGGTNTTSLGKFDRAGSFDGVNDRVDIPDSGTLSPSKITVATWVKINSYLGNYPRLISKLGSFELIMYTYPGGQGRIEWDIRIPQETDISTPFANKLNLGVWTHVAATFDGSSSKLYINGAKVAQKNNLSGNIAQTSHPLTIGDESAFGGRNINADIDEALVYNKALTESEIQALYNYQPSSSILTASKRVFLTSTTYHGDGYSAGFGGLSGADAKCQERANTANLGGNWKAWLSDSSVSASSRMTHSSVPYKLLNGTVIADSWSDLTSLKPDGSFLKHAIDVTELGTNYYPLVWTNTQPDGSITESNSIFTCVDWQQSYGGLTAYVGAPGINDFLGQKWTSYFRQDCYKPAALYCFEQ